MALLDSGPGGEPGGGGADAVTEQLADELVAEPRRERIGGGPRAAVRGLTAPARRRLRECLWAVQPSFLASVRRPGGKVVQSSSMLTLTYPVEDAERHAKDPRLHKSHLCKMWNWLVRNHPGSWAVWCVEFQQNGMVHFHLLIRWAEVPEDYVAVRDAIKDRWAELIAVGREDPDGTIRAKSRAAGVRLEAIRQPEQLAEYMSKPGTKRFEEDPVGNRLAREFTKSGQKRVVIEGQGRWWGKLNRAGYEAAVVKLEVALPDEVAWALWHGIKTEWRERFEARGLVVDENPETNENADVKHLPRWLPAGEMNKVVRKVLGDRTLFDYEMVDTKTGEVWEPEKWGAEPRKAAAG